MNWKRLMRAATLVFVFAPTVAITGDTTTLQDIMQGLRDNLVEISDGLLMNDFERVARGATAIADHPQIPAAQVQLVAAELGPEMAAFKQLDNRVHNLSLETNGAAKALDRDTAISSYQRLLEGCLACHRTYKERVAAVLSQVPVSPSLSYRALCLLVATAPLATPILTSLR